MRIGLLERAPLALATLAMLATLTCGLAGCAVAAAPSTATSATATATAPATTTATITAATTTPTYVAGAPCAASQLTLTATPEGAASGHVVTLYHFTNASGVTCSLRGYPNARLLDAQGQSLPIKVEQVAQAYTWKTTPVTTIALAPGGSAWFRAQTSDMTIQSGVTCPVAAQTIITPPGMTTGFTSSINLSTCDGVVYISPLVADPSDL